MQKMMDIFVNEKIHIRVISLLILSLVFFNGVVVISYYALPEGFLLNKNSVLNWNTSNNLIVSTVQIFLFNFISVTIIAMANFFPFPSKKKALMPSGYWCLFIAYALNGITLGTWSFTAVNTASPDLANRLLRTFNVLHRAGLWEMMGQLLIASATARIAIKKTKGVDVFVHSFREARLSKPECMYAIAGIFLMLMGALIESNAILRRY